MGPSTHLSLRGPCSLHFNFHKCFKCFKLGKGVESGELFAQFVYFKVTCLHHFPYQTGKLLVAGSPPERVFSRVGS